MVWSERSPTYAGCLTCQANNPLQASQSRLLLTVKNKLDVWLPIRRVKYKLIVILIIYGLCPSISYDLLCKLFHNLLIFSASNWWYKHQTIVGTILESLTTVTIGEYLTGGKTSPMGGKLTDSFMIFFVISSQSRHTCFTNWVICVPNYLRVRV